MPVFSARHRRHGGRRLLLVWLVAWLLAGWFTLTVVSAADGSEPLALALVSTRAVCTANTLTEVRWSIEGGTAPYRLSVDGQEVDPAGGGLLVNCGPLLDGENGATPSKTIEAEVTDAAGKSASAFVRVSLTVPLSAPKLAENLVGEPDLVVYRNRFDSGWTRGVARTDVSAQAPHYLQRWRQSTADDWQYKLRPGYIPRNDFGSLYVRSVWLNELPPGTSYEFAVSALRHELEAQSPDALLWSDAVSVTTLKNPEHVRVAASHDTFTVSWDAQPDGVSYDITVYGPEGTKRESLSADRGSTGRHEVVFRGLPAETVFRVGVQSGVLNDAVRTEVTARTAPAPPGAVELPRGPKNVRVIATDTEVLVSWDPPHPLAAQSYSVFLFDPRKRDAMFLQAEDVYRGEPTSVRFSNLRPQTAYRVQVLHAGIRIDSVERLVRTTATDSARSRAGEVPIPFGGSQVKLNWPLRFDPQYFLTADAWIWRSSSTDSRFHAGLDIGHRSGAASIRGNGVYAAADGVLRIFNQRDPKEESRRYVQYCPPGTGSPTPAKAKFPFHFRSASEHELKVNGSLVCNYVASPRSGRTALIFHGAKGAGPRVTKYAHLATIDSKLQARIQAASDGAVEVKQGDRIGTVGGSGQSNDSDYHAHLHFEVREFSGKVAANWYNDARTCAPEQFDVVNGLGYCGWSMGRKLPTVLDPEAVLPPLPAASQPTGALGQTVDTSPTPVFALRSAYPAGLSPTRLRLNLGAKVWRPRFYDRISDPEFVDPSTTVKGRNDLTGVAGTRPGVTGYRPQAGDCLAPGSALPTSPMDEGDYTFLLELRPGASCSVSIKTTNESYPSGYDGFAHPGATLSSTNLVGGQSVRTIKATLDGYDFDLYQFRVMPGQAHAFCVILNDDGDCADRTAGQTVAGKDTVLEIWSAAGVVAHDRRDGEPELTWTPGINQVGLHYLLVRGGNTLCGGPCEGGYTLRYRLPHGAGGADRPVRTLPGFVLKFMRPTAPTAPWGVEASWDSVTGDGVQYEAQVSAVGAPTVDAAVAGGTPTRFSESHWRQAGLTAARSFDVFVRAFDANGKLLAASSVRTCEGPCEVAVSNVSTTGLRVAWTALDPDILIHHVRVRSGKQVLANGYGSHRRHESLSGLKLAGETTYTAEVRLYSGTRGAYTRWAGVEFTTPEAPPPQPLALTVTPSTSTCLVGEEIRLSWTVTGGSGSYSVTVDGAEQSGGSTTLSCQGTVGAQSVAVAATDSTHTELGASEQLQLTVIAETVEASIRTQRLSDGRVEFALELADGTEITPTSRYATPSRMTDREWDESEELSAVLGGKSYPLGRVSVRLDHTVCPAALEFTFLPEHGGRITPGKHRFPVNSAVDTWLSTGAFAIALRASAVQLSPGGSADELMAESSEATACAAEPTGLATSELTSGSVKLGWDEVTGATQYDVRLDGGEATELSASARSHEFSELEPATEYQLEVRARHAGGASDWSSAAVTTTAASVPPPTGLSVTAAVSSLTLSWQAVEDATGYGVRIDGGTETTLEAAATSHPFTGLEPSTKHTLGVRAYIGSDVSAWAQAEGTTSARPTTVTARIRARRLSDDRVEFQLRLTDGTELTTGKRFLKLPGAAHGRWIRSGVHELTLEGTDYRLGVVSARLDTTTCPARVEVTFITTGGKQITPDQYKFKVDREVNSWAVTSEFAITLVEMTDSARSVQSGVGDEMDDTPDQTGAGPGREGGPMFGDSSDAGDAARAGDAETICTAQPTGLQTSNVSSSGVLLTWDEVSGASQYDVAVGDGAYIELVSTKRAHDFTGLAADTDHTLRVRARSWRGSSKWSATSVRTKALALPTVTISAGSSPIAEGTAAGFTVSSDRAPAADLSVSVTVTESGSMISGTPPSSVTIAAGQRTANLGVATVNDSRDEANSVVTARLKAGGGYRLGSASSASVTVQDNDVPPPPPSCSGAKPASTRQLRSTETVTETHTNTRATRTNERALTQPQTRTVECKNGQWVTGAWTDKGAASAGPWQVGAWSCIAKPAQPDPDDRVRPVSTTTAWEVSGTTAQQVRTVVTQPQQRTYGWSGAAVCLWQAGPWGDVGAPQTTHTTLQTKSKPALVTRQVDSRHVKTGRTRVIRVQTTPICLEQSQAQYAFTRTIRVRDHVWREPNWTPTERAITPPIRHTYWANLGGQRLCALRAVQGEQEPAVERLPALREEFGAGAHELQWGADRFSFTVPAGSQIRVESRVLPSGEVGAAFVAESGAESVVTAAAVAAGGLTSTDPVLAQLGPTLKLAAEAALPALPEDAATCAVLEVADGARVDLDEVGCVQTAGQRVSVSLAGSVITLRLGAERDWLLMAGPAPDGTEATAIWLIDLVTGSLVAIDPGKGSELGRVTAQGATEVGALFDAIADAEPP